VEAAFPAKSGTNHSEPCDVLVDMGATSHILALPDKYFIRPQRVRTPIKQLDGIVYSLLRGDVAYKYVDSEGVPRVSTFYNSLQSPPGSTEYLASISKWEDDGIKVYQNDRYISDRAGVKCPLVRRVNLYFLTRMLTSPSLGETSGSNLCLSTIGIVGWVTCMLMA
jgi:hypothetical protein